MEAHYPPAAAAGGGAAAAEVRKIHIIYFLCRKGRIEHPHLFRVHHLSRHGVRLRDVKRWLGELRGKEFPESFAWSYKRKYKTGYVWQDLLDDDLLTPISDNEYVLKGSEITPSTTTKEQPHSENVMSMQEAATGEGKATEKTDNQFLHHQTSIDEESRKTSSEIEEQEESPMFGSESSTLTEDSATAKLEEATDIHPKSNTNNNKLEKSSSLRALLSKKKRSENEEDKSGGTPLSTSSDSSNRKSASSILRNLISCRTIDTNDSAVLPVNRRRPEAAICKPEKLGGSQRIYGTNNWNQEKNTKPRKSCDGAFGSGRRSFSSTDYKSPTCSQCGKPFNPEKLHAHMKSCKGMKMWAKSNNNNNHHHRQVSFATDKDSERSSSKSRNNSSVSDYYLTS